MANDPIPTTLAPFLSVRNGAKAVDFYKSAFGAENLKRIAELKNIYHLDLTASASHKLIEHKAGKRKRHER